MNEPVHHLVRAIKERPKFRDPVRVRLRQTVEAPERPGREVGGLQETTGLGVSKHRDVGEVCQDAHPARHFTPGLRCPLDISFDRALVVDDEARLPLAKLTTAAREHLVELVENFLVGPALASLRPPLNDGSEQSEREPSVHWTVRAKRPVGIAHHMQAGVNRYLRPRAGWPRSVQWALDLGCVEFERGRVGTGWEGSAHHISESLLEEPGVSLVDGKSSDDET